MGKSLSKDREATGDCVTYAAGASETVTIVERPSTPSDATMPQPCYSSATDLQGFAGSRSLGNFVDFLEQSSAEWKLKYDEEKEKREKLVVELATERKEAQTRHTIEKEKLLDLQRKLRTVKRYRQFAEDKLSKTERNREEAELELQEICQKLDAITEKYLQMQKDADALDIDRNVLKANLCTEKVKAEIMLFELERNAKTLDSMQPGTSELAQAVQNELAADKKKGVQLENNLINYHGEIQRMDNMVQKNTNEVKSLVTWSRQCPGNQGTQNDNADDSSWNAAKRGWFRCLCCYFVVIVVLSCVCIYFYKTLTPENLHSITEQQMKDFLANISEYDRRYEI